MTSQSFEELEKLVHHVNVHEIDKENEFQAGYLYDAIKHCQNAYIDFQNAKLHFEQVEAKAWLKTKAEEKANLAAAAKEERANMKLTETDKKAHVALMPEVIAAATALVKAESFYERCNGLKQSFFARGRNVDNLTDLVKQKFLSFSKS